MNLLKFSILSCFLLLITSSIFCQKKGVLFLKNSDNTAEVKPFFSSLSYLLKTNSSITLTETFFSAFDSKISSLKKSYLRDRKINYIVTYGVKSKSILGGAENLTFFIDLYTASKPYVKKEPRENRDPLHYEWVQEDSKYESKKIKNLIKNVIFHINHGYRKKEVVVIEIKINPSKSPTLSSSSVKGKLGFLKKQAPLKIANCITKSDHLHAKSLTKDFFFKTKEQSTEKNPYEMTIVFNIINADYSIDVEIRYKYPENEAPSSCTLGKIRYSPSNSDNFYEHLIRKMMDKCHNNLKGH